MNKTLFYETLTGWMEVAARLNEQLDPYANTPIDMNEPDWEARLLSEPHPADTSGLRAQIEALFTDIIDQFESCTAIQRQDISDVMDRNDALMWSAVIPDDRDTEKGFRRHMILFVIEDQGKDTRDAILALGKHYSDAKALGIDVDKIFQDMADIASVQNKYGWGSTRDLFLKHLK